MWLWLGGLTILVFGCIGALIAGAKMYYALSKKFDKWQDIVLAMTPEAGSRIREGGTHVHVGDTWNDDLFEYQEDNEESR